MFERNQQKGTPMAVRLVVMMNAKPGKGAEMLAEMEKRCVEVRKEPGCQQFEVFQSGNDPDNLCLLELWDDQAALDVHAQKNAAAAPNPRMAELRAEGPGSREDYEYSRTR
jgi:quinol monooxygenase YgiN